MLSIRLARYGRKNNPFYRIVVIESKRSREGIPVAIIGYFDPIKKDININLSKIEEWIKKGAQITKTARKLVKLAAIK